jgi:succinoglycan biosynthesis transport protein ExoP
LGRGKQMELLAFLRTLRAKWWLVLVALLITLGATMVFTFTEPWVYQATATFVVAPTTSFEDAGGFANGLEILSRRSEIANTYAEVANSRLIKDMVSGELGLSAEQERSLFVNSQLRASTNVLEITVEGHDQVLVRDFADMVGTKVESYAQDLYETYQLKPLDQARLPTAPIRPNKSLYLLLGGALGLVLGVGLAFLVQYLQMAREPGAERS